MVLQDNIEKLRRIQTHANVPSHVGEAANNSSDFFLDPFVKKIGQTKQFPYSIKTRFGCVDDDNVFHMRGAAPALIRVRKHAVHIGRPSSRDALKPRKGNDGRRDTAAERQPTLKRREGESPEREEERRKLIHVLVRLSPLRHVRWLQQMC